jgi:hypothetical protein
MDETHETHETGASNGATCEHGHPNPPGQQFCGECGSPLADTREATVAPSDTGSSDTAPEGDDDATTNAHRRFLRPVVLVPLGLVLLLAVGGAIALASSGGGTASHQVAGTLTLTDTDQFWSDGEPCSGSGGYDDIRAGAQVVVKDETGRLLATSDLLAGKASSEYECDFAFVVNDVPDAKFYSIEISHRGEITHSRREMDGNDWIVGFTLGS